MDGYTLSISRCSGGDGVEESFKAKIKRREAALDALAVAEAYCKGIGMVSRCEREGFDGFIIGRDGSVLLDERFRPTVKTEWPHASAVNGIYPEDVADLPTIETAIPRLREIFAGADEVIGYNV